MRNEGDSGNENEEDEGGARRRRTSHGANPSSRISVASSPKTTSLYLKQVLFSRKIMEPPAHHLPATQPRHEQHIHLTVPNQNPNTSSCLLLLFYLFLDLIETWQLKNKTFVFATCLEDAPMLTWSGLSILFFSFDSLKLMSY